MSTRTIASVAVLAVLFLLTPLFVLYSQKTQRLIGRAVGTSANIVVDTQAPLEPIVPHWRSFAQGGEESGNMLAPVVDQLSTLQPRSVRIDHIYDLYHVVSKQNGQLHFDFSQLDRVVDSIVQSGAQPFLVLSYMPPAIARNGSITNEPNDWADWELVVQRTIEHFSGRQQRGIPDIYYEVWNEPDLFGNWKLHGNKNYLTLYQHTANGANRAQNTLPFKIGGPATTGLYKNWITTLLQHAQDNNLRVDFLSWHRYDTDPERFAQDIADATGWTFDYPAFTTIPKVISEWGFDSEIHPGYDTDLSAAHAVAVVRQTLFGLQHSFAFEIVDGRDPAGRALWGRWGLLTHPSHGAQTKPRFHAFALLNRMSGRQLPVTGEGSWVRGFASRDGEVIRLLLTNFDMRGTHTETVPITFTGLAAGDYILTQRFTAGERISRQVQTDGQTLTHRIFMPANSVVLLELTKRL